MDVVLGRLGDLPTAALYVARAVAAAIECVFSALPADTFVAFGAVLAARGSATPVGTFAATWAGSVAGAMRCTGPGADSARAR
ncbi:MAG: hypothetical protein ABJD07_12310 [Gemmatimonadaceae bacterium]